MTSDCKVYEHSGALGPAVVLVPIMGILGAIVLSFVYAYIDVYSPVAGYISILFVIGFAFGVGMVVSTAGRLGKCRNPLFLNVTGFFIGLLALYASWVVFIYAVVNKYSDADMALNLTSMFSSPDKIWNFIVAINNTGWYSIRSWTPSGTVLWVFWGIEALIIVGGISLLSSSSIDSEIFCEKCANWCAKTDSVHFAVPEDTTLVDKIDDGDLDVLTKFNRVSSSDYPHLRLDLYHCENCKATKGAKLHLVTVEVDDKGKAEESSEDLSNMFEISPGTFEKLQKLNTLPVHNNPSANAHTPPENPEANDTPTA